MATPKAGSQRQQGGARPGAGAAVIDERDDGGLGSDDQLCVCCDPRNPLVMRPDYGALADGSAEFALCVLHEPQPSVYRNRGDGFYVWLREHSLNAAGEIVDGAGKVVARVAGDTFQRLSNLDDDDDGPLPSDPGGGPTGGAARELPGGAARPATYHVDLSQDDFYR